MLVIFEIVMASSELINYFRISLYCHFFISHLQTRLYYYLYDLGKQKKVWSDRPAKTSCRRKLCHHFPYFWAGDQSKEETLQTDAPQDPQEMECQDQEDFCSKPIRCGGWPGRWPFRDLRGLYRLVHHADINFELEG